MRVLVLGGTGVLGEQVCDQLRRRDHIPFPVGRDVEPSDLASLRAATERVAAGAVVNLAPTVPGVVQVNCGVLGLPTVDVGVGLMTEQRRLAAAQGASAHVVSAGLFPGFSGLMALACSRGVKDTLVDVVLEQSSNANVGPAGIRDLLRLIADRRHWPTRAELRKDPAPQMGKPELLPMSHPEIDTLAGFGIRVRYWTRWDSVAQTRAIGVAARGRTLKTLTRLPSAVLQSMASHDQDKPQRASITWLCPATGEQRVATATSDYSGTAAVAASALGRVAQLSPGVYRLWDIVDVDTLARDVRGTINLEDA